MNQALSHSAPASKPPGLKPAARVLPTWSRQASFRVSIAVVAHTLWTSASPTMMYRLYAQQWHLSHAETMTIFAIYPLAVVATLMVFGNISDHIGRRAAILLGVALSLIGTLLFAVASGVDWVFVGRAFMGAGVGLSAGPASAAVLEFNSPGEATRSAAVTSAAQSAGFVSAVLLGGALVQYAPWPMHLAFIVLAVLLTWLLLCTWFLPRFRNDGAAGWRPMRLEVPRNLRLQLLVATASTMAAFMHGTLILSVGGQVAYELVKSSNGLVNGMVIAVFAGASGLVAIAGRTMATHRAIVLGAITSTVGATCFAFAAAFCSFPVFLFAAACSGVGYSLLFLGGLALVQQLAPASNRGGMISVLYLFAYLAQAGSAFALGAAASAMGLKLAVYAGVAVITLSSTGAALLVFSTRADRRS